MSFRLQVATMMFALMALLWGRGPSEAADVSAAHPPTAPRCNLVATAASCGGPASNKPDRSGDDQSTHSNKTVAAGSRDQRASPGGGCEQGKTGTTNISVNAPIASCNPAVDGNDSREDGGCNQSNTGNATISVNAPIGSCNSSLPGADSGAGDAGGRGCSQGNSGQNVANVNAPVASCNG